MDLKLILILNLNTKTDYERNGTFFQSCKADG